MTPSPGNLLIPLASQNPISRPPPLGIFSISFLLLSSLVLTPSLPAKAADPVRPETLCERYITQAESEACQKQISSLHLNWYLAGICRHLLLEEAFQECLNLSKTHLFDPKKIQVCEDLSMGDDDRLTCLKKQGHPKNQKKLLNPKSLEKEKKKKSKAYEGLLKIPTTRPLLPSLLLLFLKRGEEKASASPHPGMGSSYLRNPKLGLEFLGQGFTIRIPKSQWELEKEPQNSLPSAATETTTHPTLSDPSPQNELTLRYKNIPRTQSSLAIQSYPLKKPMSLEEYTKTWVKDYAQFRFDILGTRIFTNSQASKGFVVDLIHRGGEDHLRQILFLNTTTQKVVLFTCRGPSKDFNPILKACNEIVKTFTWLKN